MQGGGVDIPYSPSARALSDGYYTEYGRADSYSPDQIEFVQPHMLQRRSEGLTKTSYCLELEGKCGRTGAKGRLNEWGERLAFISFPIQLMF